MYSSWLVDWITFPKVRILSVWWVILVSWRGGNTDRSPDEPPAEMKPLILSLQPLRNTDKSPDQPANCNILEKKNSACLVHKAEMETYLDWRILDPQDINQEYVSISATVLRHL